MHEVKRYDFAPLAPETREDPLVIVVGWPWNLNVTLSDEGVPLDLTTHRVLLGFWWGGALTANLYADVAPSSVHAGHVTFALSEAQTAILRETPSAYAVFSQHRDGGAYRLWTRGRIDLLTPDEYYKSIRRVKLTIPIGGLSAF